ncbi:MAG TPA: hypothetical protein VJT31_02795 [Rugosimonospora sp.]|nr:hypothetical protein [Rugosimonospora sp.]
MNRRRRPTGDGGATLVVVLIVITVIAVAVSALLSFGDTSIRVTVQLRGQAATAYAADAAGEAAVNALRGGTFNGSASACVTTSGSWALGNVYPGHSTYVGCTPDSSNTSANSPNASPGSAVLTLGTSSSEDGISISSNAGSVKVRGGIFSNSTIKVSSGGLTNTYTPQTSTYTIARGACTGTITPTPTCNYGSTTDSRGVDPGTLTPHGVSYDPPAAPTSTPTIPSCGNNDKYQQLSPGLYTSAANLNALSGCQRGIVYFSPGTYYFNFQDSGSHVWTIQNTWVLAGTPTTPSYLTANPSVSTWPDACVKPQDAAATTTSGVLFVFGGDSQMTVTHQGNPGGQVTICASKSSGGPPIAIYGLKTALSGTLSVPAESGCVTTVGGCPLIYTDQSPNTTLTIQGTTYTPKALMSISLNNNTNQVFRWGLITRAIQINTTGSASLANAVIDVPDVAVTPIANGFIYLNVYVCPDTSACDSSRGTLTLRVRVQLLGTSPQTVKILSWSSQR